MADATLRFPTHCPRRGSFPRPFAGETLTVSPPGFCWWRAAPAGECAYRLVVRDAAGAEVYRSEPLADPVHVPAVVFEPGDYRWTVELLVGEAVIDTWPSARFRIAEGAVAQPWVEPAELLARVPREHPRVLFLRDSLDAVRASLATTRAESFAELQYLAGIFEGLELPPEPTYDQITDPAERRLAYRDTFREFRRYHNGALRHLALSWLLTGERRHGEAARAILMATTTWDPDGISSVSAPYGDELGLGIAKSIAEGYDWLHDLLDEDERQRVEAMIIARGNGLLARLQRQDFLAQPQNSHNGRLPGYLLEHALAVAEAPEAAVWVDYALRALLTVYPHWGGVDGGWAEGMSYGLAYNGIFLMPFEAWARATGFDLWQRPFYGKVRRFFAHNISPVGEIMPWGDQEDQAVPPRASSIRGLLRFHALKYRDPLVRAWCDLLHDEQGKPVRAEPLPGLLLPDDLPPGNIADLPLDAAWHDVGWATFHTAIDRPADDLMVMFKSSPYGGISHSHADQNSFAILKGGRALAIPAGQRYPQHGTPFHTDYVQTTLAHNTVLVNEVGQVYGGGAYQGWLSQVTSTPSLALATGQATRCYAAPVTRAVRHLLLVRSGLIVIVDEIAASEPVSVQWLLHTKERMVLDEVGQTVGVQRGESRLDLTLLTMNGLHLTQTDAWPVAPREGFPTASEPEPTPQWHLTAATRVATPARRILAVLAVDGHPFTMTHDLGWAHVEAGDATIDITLGGPGPVIEARCGADRVVTT